jgi:hypothetical protein
MIISYYVSAGASRNSSAFISIEFTENDFGIEV